MKIKPTQSFIDGNRAEQLLEKWAPVLNFKSDSVRGISDDNTRLNTAILLENQEQWCESNTAGNGGAFGGGAQTTACIIQVQVQSTAAITTQLVTHVFLRSSFR
jgi:hypothetical protein